MPDHLSDSIGVLGEAIATAGISSGPAQGCDGPGPDPAARVRSQAARLLGTCAAAGPGGRRAAIGDRELTASMAAVTAAIEITVHGWDIFAGCGAAWPVPLALAAGLLPTAPLLITAGTRPGLPAGPAARPSRPRRPVHRLPRPPPAAAGRTRARHRLARHPAQRAAAIAPGLAGLYQQAARRAARNPQDHGTAEEQP